MTERKTGHTKKQTAGSDNSMERALLAARTATENRGRDVVVLDMRGLVKWVDYMILVTGTSRRQIVSIADGVEKALKEMGDKKIGTEGYELGSWIVLDFEDLIIHVFDDEKRKYYELEHLWGDAPRVEWKKLAGVEDLSGDDAESSSSASITEGRRSSGDANLMQGSAKAVDS